MFGKINSGILFYDIYDVEFDSMYNEISLDGWAFEEH